MLQDNASDNPNVPDLPMRAPKMGEVTAKLEAELTLRTQSILRKFQRIINVTKQETEIDFLLRQVCTRFAYDGRGLNVLPMNYRPGVNYSDQMWWPCLKYQLVGLVYTYYDAIKDHNIQPFLTSATRLEEMLDVGIREYKLSPGENFGFVLRTQAEWNAIKAAKAEREIEIFDNKERLREKRRGG